LEDFVPARRCTADYTTLFATLLHTWLTKETVDGCQQGNQPPSRRGRCGTASWSRSLQSTTRDASEPCKTSDTEGPLCTTSTCKPGKSMWSTGGACSRSRHVGEILRCPLALTSTAASYAQRAGTVANLHTRGIQA
ncbi:unnamed protein product, partial [Ectocarpus sp. 12 AP-2014]